VYVWGVCEDDEEVIKISLKYLFVIFFAGRLARFPWFVCSDDLLLEKSRCLRRWKDGLKKHTPSLALLFDESNPAFRLLIASCIGSLSAIG
jgi:hypothetical protein